MNLRKYQLHIDGCEIDSSSQRWFESYNPFTAEPWALIPESEETDVDRAVRSAHTALVQGPWAEMTPSQRGRLLYRLGDLVANSAKQLTEVEVRDNGKLISEVKGQIDYIPNWYYYFGGLADKIEGAVLPLDKKGYFNFTRREPVGVVAVITPWNSPLLIASWKIAPALAAGCTVVIKPSEFTSASTLEFAQLCEEAGFPRGVVNVVTGFGDPVGAALVSHPLVKKISFTGSDATGRMIHQLAGKQLKHVSLELGGKSPNIVFSDADLDQAVLGAISGIFAATGQTCIAGSRLLLEEQIHDEFLARLMGMAGNARMGDPMSFDTQIGPITTQPQYRKVLDYIQIAEREGAKLLLGGKPASRPECGKGWFIEPTIFTGVKNSMRIAQEEVFGPVLSVIKFKDEEEAIAIANDSRFGLGAGIWSNDVRRMHRMAEKIQAGTIWVNCYRAVSYLSPFGGYKDSGLGRENGREAIGEYLQTKSVWINTGAATANPFVMR